MNYWALTVFGNFKLEIKIIFLKFQLTQREFLHFGSFIFLEPDQEHKHLKSLLGFSRLLRDWYQATSQWLFEIIFRIVKFPNTILLEID